MRFEFPKSSLLGVSFCPESFSVGGKKFGNTKKRKEKNKSFDRGRFKLD